MKILNMFCQRSFAVFLVPIGNTALTTFCRFFELRGKLERVGFQVRRISYNNFLLFPPAAALIALRRGARRESRKRGCCRTRAAVRGRPGRRCDE